MIEKSYSNQSRSAAYLYAIPTENIQPNRVIRKGANSLPYINAPVNKEHKLTKN